MSEFNTFCMMPKAVIKKVAATVPLYTFTGPVDGQLVGADLDGNGKVDLISSDSVYVSRRYENIKNHGDLKNGLWQSTAGTITRQELIGLREGCSDADNHRTAKSVLLGGAGVSALGAVAVAVCVFAGAPVAMLGAAVVSIVGLMVTAVPSLHLQSIDATVEEKLDSLLWRKTKPGALL